MLKILLVDDEPLVLVGIQSMLKWEDYDAEIVATARNGAQALELICSIRPDLIITDVKMPVMDGIQLLKESRKRFGRFPQFLILTSYEEYQFVKEAINEQAVDYLVKFDLTEHKLLSAIGKVREQLNVYSGGDGIRRVPAEHIGMQAFYDRFFLRLYNNLFENQAQFEMQYKELGVDFSFDGYVVCMCEICPDNGEGTEEKRMNLFSSTIHMCWEVVTRFMPCYVTGLDMRHFVITFCLSQAELPDYRQVLRDVIEKTENSIYNYFNVRLCFSVGHLVHSPFTLSESYHTARLCQNTTPKETLRFFSQDDGATESELFDLSAYRDKLLGAFEEQDADALERVLIMIIRDVRRSPSRRLQAMDAACNVLFLCMSQLTDGEEVVSQLFQDEPDGYLTLYQQHTVEGIASWMETMRDGLSQMMRSRKRDYKENLVVQIKAYIQANLDKRLSLNRVAAVFGFSANYLSQLFAKQASQSFVEYVTEEKIRLAKEIMQQNNIKIYEIAERLGFENAFYFSKVFKKVVGVSPREYMQTHTEAHSGAAKQEEANAEIHR